MSKIIDITGQKFNMLTVICIDESVSMKRGVRWICKCECGNIVSRYSQKLRNGTSYSCGCKKRPREKASGTPKPKRSYIHYQNDPEKRRLNNTYNDMKKRCYNPNNKSYKYYGAKGVTICDEWLNSFDSFYNWALSNGYKNDLSIDRIDNSKGYSPNNCRWVTLHEQQQNKTNKILITHENMTLNMKQWCKKLNLDYGKVSRRRKILVSNGIDINYDVLFGDLEIYNKPKKRNKKILQCDDAGAVIHVYSSISEAVKAGFSQPEISKICNNVPHYIHHRGYRWKYAE